MKTIPVRFNYSFANIAKISINNEMAPLIIANSEDEQIIIEADLALKEIQSDLILEPYFDVDYSDSIVNIHLDDLVLLSDGFMFMNQSQVRIYIPQGLELEVRAENQALKLTGLTGKIEVENENAAITLANCDGAFIVENENGPIKIYDCTGDTSIEQENGTVLAQGISGDILKIETENGAVKVRLAQFTNVSIESENGLIFYESMPIDRGEFSFQNENGKVILVLPEALEFAIEAQSELGRIKSNLKAELKREGGKYILYNGQPNVQIQIKTENGGIRLSSDAYVNLGFFKSKLNDLRKAIQKSQSLEDNEKVQQLMQKTIDSLDDMIEKIGEAKIKQSIQNSIASLRKTVLEQDLTETKDKALKSIEMIGNEISTTLRGFFAKMKYTDKEKDEHFAFDFGRHFDDLADQVQSLFAAKTSKHSSRSALNPNLQREVNEQSRRKILQLLESGKITADEAERLLRAMGKE